MSITTRFSGRSPVSMAQGRHGELIIVQGNGVRPARWTGSGVAVDAGMDAPAAKPDISLNSAPKYYIARIDVQRPGAVYYAPPAVSFSRKPDANGAEAVASSYLEQAALSEIRVKTGGKYYADTPTVTLSDTHGKGAIITAQLDAPDTTSDDPTNNKRTGITTWDIVESPAGQTDENLVARFAAVGLKDIDLPITGNGNFEYSLPYSVATQARTVTNCSGPSIGFTTKLKYTVSGYKSGSGAVLRLKWSNAQFVASCVGATGAGAFFYQGSTTLDDALAAKYGANYDNGSKVRVTIQAVRNEGTYVIEGMTNGNPDNAAAERYAVKSLTVTNGGSGYVVTPLIKITSDTGFGAYATCTVRDGKVVSVKLENCGSGYASAPTVEVVAGGAEAFAVARPHLRGLYQCYYRYVDDTPKDSGGPIPSNLSPVTEIDAGEGATSIQWNPAPATGRAKKIELWRSTANEALTLYRVTTCTGTFLDDLTDEELRDPDRTGYAAMPIVLPNGAMNANRFGVPPSNKSAVVRFQDRFWYGVDTSGKEANSIYYSETDEPESVPPENEIVLQCNARDADSLKAMIPFGSTLLLMQERHCYSLSFAKAPLLDAQVTPLAFRGCLNQRSWDIYGGTCYAMDQYGIYGITPNGTVEVLSDAIDNVFCEEVQFASAAWSFLLVDAKTKTLRAFLRVAEDGASTYPTRALCYSLDTKAWWVEKYPQRISGGSPVRLSNGDFRSVYAADSGPVMLGEGAYDFARGAVSYVSLLAAGEGYRTPPAVTATGGSGATFQASINAQGQLAGIWILSPGFGYSSGALTIEPPNDPNATVKERASATYHATPLSADTPTFPTYRYKSGCAEYVTDAQNPEAGSEMSRSITLRYEPQPSRCELSLRTYYNNSPSPRHNVAPRDRGAGFSHSTIDAAARYDMAAPTVSTGWDTGVATALFSGRTISDIRSGDRHIAVELVGARANKHPLVFYTLDVAGTLEAK